jgi:integrase
VEDLDLEAEIPTLTVTGTVVRADGRLMRQPKPKSDSSRRTITLPTFVVAAIRTALDLGLDGGPDDLVFPSTKGSPRSPGRVRDQLRAAQEDTGIDVTPHDFRRTVATQVARGSTLAHATALLGHADESTTARHYVQRIHVAPDLRVVIDQLVAQASDEASI